MSRIPSSIPVSHLADRAGRFAMLALDQRESLRTMIAARTRRHVADEELVQFKSRAAAALSRHTTAVLVDRLYGLPSARVATSPVILAADTLIQEAGGPVTDAMLDPEVTPAVVKQFNATALKMLVPWDPAAPARAIDLAAEFMDLCRATALPGIVEGVVRPAGIESWPDEERNDALVAAARDLATANPDLYKAEVPSYGRGDKDTVKAVSARITQVLNCPWVVLSSGVAASDFPAAVAACKAGGASGFLAGRAVWADAFSAPDVGAFLSNESTRRLRVLQAEDPNPS